MTVSERYAIHTGAEVTRTRLDHVVDVALLALREPDPTESTQTSPSDADTRVDT
jgi:hypothetical protein